MRDNKEPGFGQREFTESHALDLKGILESDPLSTHFKVPKVKTTKDLLLLLIARQQKAFGTTILVQFSYPILLRGLKLLQKEFTLDEIARGIVYSVQVANYPGSIKFVKECCICLRELVSQPLNQSEQTTTQNKS